MSASCGYRFCNGGRGQGIAGIGLHTWIPRQHLEQILARCVQMFGASFPQPPPQASRTMGTKGDAFSKALGHSVEVRAHLRTGQGVPGGL